MHPEAEQGILNYSLFFHWTEFFYLATYPSVHFTSPHRWDATMLDVQTLTIALLQIEGSMDH